MAKRVLFDTHCHLVDDRFEIDREQLIESLPEQGVFACLTCGCSLSSSFASLQLAERYPFVFFAAGIHPHETLQAVDEDLHEISQLLKHKKAVALGEIGLDYHYEFSPRETQQIWLKKQLDLAYDMGLPVVMHVRESHGAVLEILNARKNRLPEGVMHCFSGSAHSAMEYQRLGFYISFAGSLTFKNAHKLREAAQAVSLDRLLIETDSPYLAPEPYRGKRNDPGKLKQVCQLLADLHHMSYEEMAYLTCQNACKLLGVTCLAQKNE